MRRMRAWLNAMLTQWRQRRRVEHELDDELHYHVAQETAANVARGLAPDEARRAALRDLGGLTQTRDSVRDVRATWIDRRTGDVRVAWRHLVRDARAHTLLVTATLAVGLGGAAAIFALADSVVWHPTPFPEVDRLVRISTELPPENGSFRTTTASPEQVLAWRDQRDLFDQVEAYQAVTLVYQAAAEAHLVRGASVTPGLLRLAGLMPQAGRIFSDEEALPGMNRVVVVSYEFCVQHLGRADAVVGGSIELDSIAYRVVGVAPRSFRFPDAGTRIWIPETLAPPDVAGGDPNRIAGFGLVAGFSSMLRPIAKLSSRDNATFDQIDAQVQARGAAVNEAAGSTARSAGLEPLAGAAGQRARRIVGLLGAGAAGLLLVIIVNASALMISRGLARRPMWTMKAALGASRATLVREVMVEQAGLGAIACAGAVAVAVALVAVLPTAMPGAVISSLNPIDFDARTAAFVVAASIVAIVIASVPMCVMAASTSRHLALRESGRRVSSSRSTRRVGRALIAIEVALSLTLVIGTALMGRSLLALQAVDRGFRTDGVVALNVALPASGYTSMAAREQFVTDALAVVASTPGVEGVSSGALPPGASMKRLGVRMSDEGRAPAEKRFSVMLYEVHPGFFDVLEMPVLAGRAFTEADDPAEAVVVNEAFARTYWADAEAAVGRRFQTGFEAGTWRTVVGVVGNVRSLAPDARDSEPQAYVRAGVYHMDIAVGFTSISTLADERTFVARLSGDGATARDLAAAITGIDRTVVVRGIESMDDIARRESASIRFVFTLVAAFGVLALLVSTMGLYGLLANDVARQRHEIGVRLALGASARSIGRRIVGRALAVTMAGLGVGLLVAAASVDVIRSELYVISPFDAVSVVVACAALVVAAVVASVRPAARAMHVDPVELLRAE